MLSIIFLCSIFFVAIIGLPVANAGTVTNNDVHIVPIKRTKNTTVTIDTNSTFPGQSFDITIYKPEPLPYGAQLKLGYIPAKDNPILYENSTKKWVAWSDSGTWNSTTTSLTMSTYFNEWKYGLYKVVVLANGIVIGVSKPLKVKLPNIQIPLSKRTYYQWESIPTTAIRPYPTLKKKVSYSYEILPKSQPDSYYSSDEYSKKQFDYPENLEYGITLNSTLVTFSPGLYNIRIVVRTQVYNSQWNFSPYKVDYVTSIRNTTFKVIENNAQISIANNQTNFKYGDIVNFSLTTTNKVPLTGPIKIWKITPDIRTVALLKQDSATSGNTTTNSHTLYGTFTIEPSTVGCQWKPQTIEISTLYYKYGTIDFQNPDAAMLSIDATSRPKEDCTSNGTAEWW